MTRIANIILTIEGLVALIFIVLIVYLIIRRINIKQEEDFEKRDN
jgi:uncharacterized membrane protein